MKYVGEVTSRARNVSSVLYVYLYKCISFSTIMTHVIEIAERQ